MIPREFPATRHRTPNWSEAVVIKGTDRQREWHHHPSTQLDTFLRQAVIIFRSADVAHGIVILPNLTVSLFIRSALGKVCPAVDVLQRGRRRGL